MDEIKACYIGVMSGTSLDGVDVVLCPVGADGIELAASLAYPFDAPLKADILRVIGGATTLKEIGEIDRRLGHLFADAVLALIEKHDLDAQCIDAIGLHGQTLWHAPDGDAPFTMQLGDPNIVCARTGIDTVADFRRKDMAFGGQGAPFAPAFHRFLFEKLESGTVVVNIGGMANITVIGEPLLGYDTGSGERAHGRLVQAEVFRGPTTPTGRSRSAPRRTTACWTRCSPIPISRNRHPKARGGSGSTRPGSAPFFKKRGARDDTVLSTLTELTARSIADEAAKYAPERLLLCGGGASNVYLRGRIAALLEGVEVERTDAYGVPGEWMEAMAFAWLAYKRMNAEPVALKSVTGASQDTILGGVYAV